MRRRDFVKTSALAFGGALAPRSLRAWQASEPTPNPAIRRVLVMFKCHFDAGFINTQAAVVHRYFTEFFPQAIAIAEQSRQAGRDRYVWTTGSWLLYEYLEQASAADRERMERAILTGDIAWHAIPFNWQTEMMDASVISASIGLSHSLDQRFSRMTTGSKMTDVPGHTRGLIAPVAAQGVKYLDIGVNHASTPADVPEMFVWKDTSGATLLVTYHSGYGTVTPIPGSETAIAIMVRADNSGPHPPAEIAAIYADLRKQFPRAEIEATNLTEIGNAIQPYRDHLPVVTEEIGDSWIYGVGSDPLKVVRYREMLRLRQRWIDAGHMQAADPIDIALLRKLLLEAEHTWGTDTKTWLDFEHYTPAALATMLQTKNYKVVEFSWEEKRQDLFDAVATLPAALRAEANSKLQSLQFEEPAFSREKGHDHGDIETKHFVVAIDPVSGAIHRLRNKRSGREWASGDHPLAALSYQTLSGADYDRFFKEYLIIAAKWAHEDFGKPNMDQFGAVSREWQPRVQQMERSRTARGQRVLTQLAIDDPESVRVGRAAYPQRFYVEYLFPDDEPQIEVNVSWFQKPATRMSEAIWLTFHPSVQTQQGWSMDKSGEQVSPFDVAVAGSRHMHAVMRGFGYRDTDGNLEVETLDAPLIALGEKSALNFSRAQPDLSSGIHCNLFNNAWGTNYIMWFGENMRFRFVLKA